MRWGPKGGKEITGACSANPNKWDGSLSCRRNLGMPKKRIGLFRHGLCQCFSTRTATLCLYLMLAAKLIHGPLIYAIQIGGVNF